jgi:hypothetical protein
MRLSIIARLTGRKSAESVPGRDRRLFRKRRRSGLAGGVAAAEHIRPSAGLRLDRAVQRHKRRRGRPSPGHHARDLDQEPDPPGIHQLRIRRRTLPGVPEVGLTGPAGRQHHSREDVYDCIEQAPQAFIGMLRGENFGKVLIRLTDEAS